MFVLVFYNIDVLNWLEATHPRRTVFWRESSLYWCWKPIWL